MSLFGINCPKCSREGKPVLTKRKNVPAGTQLQVTRSSQFNVNHPFDVDHCVRCRGYYPVELNGVRL